MDRTAIEKITELAAPNFKEIYNHVYTDKKMEVISAPKAATLKLHTLEGLVKTIKGELPDLKTPLLINVYDEETVNVYSPLFFEDRKREKPYEVNAEVIELNLNYRLDYEQMIIMLKSRFVETEELLQLVKLLGNITEEDSTTTSDDGITQNVVVRKGIVTKERSSIKPIVKLKPYRTFREVEQPESEFLLRLSEGGYIALYEADGGAWKLQARRNVAEYLRKELEFAEKAVIITE